MEQSINDHCAWVCRGEGTWLRCLSRWGGRERLKQRKRNGCCIIFLFFPLKTIVLTAGFAVHLELGKMMTSIFRITAWAESCLSVCVIPQGCCWGTEAFLVSFCLCAQMRGLLSACTSHSLPHTLTGECSTLVGCGLAYV